MSSPGKYRKAVVISTVVLCAIAALAWYVVPGVREGTVPPIGGILWHFLGAFEYMLRNVHAPVAARVGEATAPLLGVVFLLALIAASALVASLVVCLPFRLSRKR